MYVLKWLPEDFVVEELPLPSFAPKPAGPYLVLRVTKRQRNTEEVALLLSRAFRVPRNAIGYAGAKDRQAVTTQYFTVKGKRKEDAASLSFENVTCEPLGRVEEPLAIGLLAGNRFTIMLRNLDGTKGLSLPGAVPNYFDEQRFSSTNAALGEALVTKRFGDAARLLSEDARLGALVRSSLEQRPNDHVGALMTMPRHLLKLCLHAYQSLLWNRALARLVASSFSATWSVPFSLGELVFPVHLDPPSDPLSGDPSLRLPPFDALPSSLPIPGFGSAPHRIVDAVVAEAGLTPRDFVLPQLGNLSLEGGERPTMMAVTELSAGPFEEDEGFPGKKKCMIRFTLGKGSYATMLVKALFG